MTIHRLGIIVPWDSEALDTLNPLIHLAQNLFQLHQFCCDDSHIILRIQESLLQLGDGLLLLVAYDTTQGSRYCVRLKDQSLYVLGDIILEMLTLVDVVLQLR